MPRERSAYKEIRKAKKRHSQNIATRTELKTFKKNFDRLITEKKLDEAKKLLPQLISKINRASTKGVLKKNTASRHVSRLSKRLSSAAKA